MIGAELAHRGVRHRDETGRNATRQDAGWGTGGAPARVGTPPTSPPRTEQPPIDFPNPRPVWTLQSAQVIEPIVERLRGELAGPREPRAVVLIGVIWLAGDKHEVGEQRLKLVLMLHDGKHF
jgi:hypothetical protein